MKKLFLFIILVNRFWAIGSSEANKTGRGKSALTTIVTAYLIGGLLNSMLVTHLPLKDIFGGNKEFFIFIVLIVLATMIFAPIFYIKKQFPNELIAEKVAQPDYEAKYNKPINHFLVLLFDVGGFIVLFLLPRWLS